MREKGVCATRAKMLVFESGVIGIRVRKLRKTNVMASEKRMIMASKNRWHDDDARRARIREATQDDETA